MVDTDPPGVNDYDDFTVTVGEEFSIEWYPYDDNPWKYEIYRNDVLFRTNDWSVSAASIEVHEFEDTAGTYNYTIIVYDLGGNTATDTVIVTVVPAVVITAVIPWGRDSFTLFGRTITPYIADINVGVLYIMSIASIAVYGIVLAGWSSNNKYAMMGGLRSTAQMVSYELALGLSFVTAILLANSMRMLDIVEAQKNMWFAIPQFIGFIIFLAYILTGI